MFIIYPRFYVLLNDRNKSYEIVEIGSFMEVSKKNKLKSYVDKRIKHYDYNFSTREEAEKAKEKWDSQILMEELSVKRPISK